MESVGTWIVAIAAGLALAAAAGLRAFMPLLVLCLAARFGWVDLSDRFAFLGSDVALGALLLASFLELVADKIPLVDHLLDSVSTFVRPVSAFLASLAVMADLPEPVGIGLALLFAVVALGTHVERAKTRVGSTALTAGVGNPILSVIEDAIAGVLSFLAVWAPLVALGVLLLLGWLAWRTVRRLRGRKREPGLAEAR